MTASAIDTSLRLASGFHGVGDGIEIIYVGPDVSNTTRDFQALVSRSWKSSQANIVFVYGSNSVYHAMNVGIARAQSLYIYFCGDTDFPYLDTLLISISSLQSNNLYPAKFAILLGKVSTSSALLTSRLPSVSGLKFLIERNPTHHQGIIYAKQAFLVLGKYSNDFHVLGDYHFNLMLRLLVHSSNSVVEVYAFDSIFCDFADGGLSSRSSFSNYMESFLCKKPYISLLAMPFCYFFECACFAIKRLRLARYFSMFKFDLLA